MEEQLIRYLSKWERTMGLYIPKKISKAFARHIGMNLGDFFVHKSRIKMVDIPKCQKNLIYLIVSKMEDCNSKEVKELAKRIPLVVNYNIEAWAYNMLNFYSVGIFESILIDYTNMHESSQKLTIQNESFQSKSNSITKLLKQIHGISFVDMKINP